MLDASGGLLAIVARAIAFAAIVVVVGAVAFHGGVLQRWTVARPGDFEVCANIVGRAGGCAATALVLGAPVRLYAQARSLVDAGDPVMPMMANVLHTMWGRGWMLQACASLGALAGFLVAHRHARGGWRLALASSLGLTLSPALMGHAIAAEHWLAVSVLADWLHVAAAGAWVGALAILALTVRFARAPGTDVDAPAATLIELFHPVALTCSAMLVATGVVSLVLRVNSISDLLHSTYGAILAVKLALTLGVAALGLHHARRGAQLARLRGTQGVGRTLAAETMLAGMVIVVTALLVGTAPPMGMVMTGRSDHSSSTQVAVPKLNNPNQSLAENGQ